MSSSLFSQGAVNQEVSGSFRYYCNVLGQMLYGRCRLSPLRATFNLVVLFSLVSLHQETYENFALHKHAHCAHLKFQPHTWFRLRLLIWINFSLLKEIVYKSSLMSPPQDLGCICFVHLFFFLFCLIKMYISGYKHELLVF